MDPVQTGGLVQNRQVFQFGITQPVFDQAAHKISEGLSPLIHSREGDGVVHQSLVLGFMLAPQISCPIVTETTSVLYEEIVDGFVAVSCGAELLLAHHREVFVVNLSEIHHRGLQQSDDGLVNVVASNRIEFARQRCGLNDGSATAAAI